MKKIIVLIIFFAFIFSLGNFNVNSTINGDNYSGNGDWIINNETVVENETIILNGNLLIYDALTFKNTTLIVNSSFNGEYKIEVFKSGAFYIYNNSNITSMNNSNNYNFFVNNGGTLVIKNSSLSYCGYYVYDENETDLYFNVKVSGLWINTTNAIIENSSFYNNYIGLVVQGKNAKIENNSFSENSYGTIFYYSLNNSFKKNYIANNNFGVFIFNSNSINIEGNKLQNNSLQIYVDRINYTSIKENEINNTDANDSDYAIVIWRSENNNLINNLINSYYGIYLYYSLNAKNLIANNTINAENNGFFIYNATENSILNNTIFTDELGFFFDFNSFYNTIDNNRINGDLYYHILNKNNLTFNNLNLQNNKITNLGKVSLINSENITIKNSILANNSYYGIYLYNSSYNNIENNTISSNSQGIFIQNSFSNLIKNNSLNANIELGISFSDINAFYNTIKNNTIDGEIYYHILNEINLTLNNLNLQSNFATNIGKISIIDSKNITISNSLIANNTYGIFILNSSYININSSKINLNEDGIYIENSQYNNIKNSNITNNSIAIEIANSSYNLIENSNLSSYGIGIYGYNSNNNSIINNELNNSVHGIYIENSNNNNITTNYINFNSIDGLSLYNSHYNIIRNNEFINNSNSGIYLYYCFNNNIFQNNFSANYIGIFIEISSLNNIYSNILNSSYTSSIYIYNSKNILIQENILVNAYFGIRILNSTDILINENNISYNYYGIYSENSLNNISYNEFYNNSDFAIYFFNCSANSIKNNLLNNNEGIYLLNSNANFIEENILTYNFYGIYIENSNNNTIKNSIANYSISYGIYLKNSNNNILTNISANYNSYGIYLFSSKNNTINSIVKYNNNAGIYLYNSNNNEISSSVSYNYNGIFIYESNYNNISSLIFNNSFWGIYLLLSENNLIFNSNISYNPYGTWLYNSSDNVIKKNNFYKNYFGITLEDAISNYIYLNNFIENNNSCYDNGNNTWNLSYGNYFSDYIGEDENNDGIGDTPYNISGGENKDYLPLIVSFGLPFVGNVSNEPISPLPSQTIKIYASVIDLNNNIIEVILYYYYNNSWQNITMSLNGNYSAEINGFNENEVIEYYVKAIDSEGNYNISNIKTIIIQNIKPNKVNLDYYNLTSYSIVLKWSKNTNNDFRNYTIFLSLDSIKWSYLANITNQNITSYDIENLSENTNYYFKIITYDFLGLYNESNIISLKTLNAVPNSSILSYFSLTSYSVILSWSKNNNSDFKNYTIFISYNRISWSLLTSISSQSTLSYSINNLSENTNYYFKIITYDLGNLYNESNIIDIKTLNAPPNSSILEYSSLTYYSLSLNWSKNTNNDFESYRIYISSDNLNWQLIIKITNQDTTFYNITSLSENTNYYFKIITYDLGNLYNESNIISLKTLNIPPNSVILSVLLVEYTSIKLTWTKNTNSDFKNYTLFISTNDSELGSIVYSTPNRDANVYTVKDLSQNTTYYFILRVYDSLGLYSDSSQLKSKTLAMPNQSPNVYIGSHKDNDRVSNITKISGTASDDNIVIKVEFRIDNENWQIANGTAFWYFYWNTTNYNNGNHRVYIRAYDGELYSEELLIVLNVQNEIVIGKKPSPVSISILEITKNSIRISWTKNIDVDFLKYEILISEDESNWNLINTIQDRNITEYSINNLKENTKYFIKIKVSDKENLYSESEVVSATTKKEEKFIEDKIVYILIGISLAVLIFLVIFVFYFRRMKE